MTNNNRLREEPQQQTHKWIYTGYRGQQLPPLERQPREARTVINLSPRERGNGQQALLTRWIRHITESERRANGFKLKTLYYYTKQFKLDLERLIRLRYRLIEHYPRGLDQQSNLDRFC